jgi:hypothetical protein
MSSSVIIYAVSMRYSGAVNNLYALSSWEIIVGWCCQGLRRGLYGNNAVLMGILGRFDGTIGDGAVVAFWFDTLGVGSSTLVVGSFCGSILSNIAANSLISCILSDRSCFNGVAGAG